MSTERTTMPVFARSRASKGHSQYAKPLSPAQMRERSLAQNKAVALEQAKMRERKVTISRFFQNCKYVADHYQQIRMYKFKERGQFKGGIAV